MLRYRASLVDKGVVLERPVQTLSQSVKEVREWAALALAKATKDAYVVVYRVDEIELGTIRRNDQGAVQGTKSAPKKTDQPG